MRRAGPRTTVGRAAGAPHRGLWETGHRDQLLARGGASQAPHPVAWHPETDQMVVVHSPRRTRHLESARPQALHYAPMWLQGPADQASVSARMGLLSHLEAPASLLSGAAQCRQRKGQTAGGWAACHTTGLGPALAVPQPPRRPLVQYPLERLLTQAVTRRLDDLADLVCLLWHLPLRQTPRLLASAKHPQENTLQQLLHLWQPWFLWPFSSSW